MSRELPFVDLPRGRNRECLSQCHPDTHKIYALELGLAILKVMAVIFAAQCTHV